MPASSPGLASKVDQLLRQEIKDLAAPSLEDVHRLVYELELRRVDLEQQNEELLATQRRLEAYRDRYIDLYDFAPLGYVTLDQDGYVQEINLAGAKMLGVEREALTGHPFADYVSQGDQKAFFDHVRQCVTDRRDVTSELRLVAGGRPSLAAQLRSIPIDGPKEEVFCKTAITDITHRRDMEDTIRQSREFLQAVIDAIPETMLVIGRDYRILLANRAAREMAGGIDPTVCLTCHKLSHHRDLPCNGENDPCPLHQIIETKAPTTVTHTHYDVRGREVFVEISAAPVLDAAGEVTCIIEACRDVTERRRAESALEHERNLLRTLIDNLPDFIYVKDTQSRFVTANLAAARIMGVAAPADLLGKTDGDFYPPELAAEYRADEETLMRLGQSLVNKDEPHQDSAGNPRTVLTTKVPLRDNQGRVFGLVGISRDITDRKQGEERLRQAQEQLLEHQRQRREQVEAELAKAKDQLVRQARLAAIGQIAASVVHDLRNSLFVMGSATTCLKRCASGDYPQCHKYIGDICQEIDANKRLAANLMEMARVKQPQKERVALGDAAREVFEPLGHGTSVALETQFDPDPFVVAADPVQLRQVLGNLFANAVQAMRDGGRVRLHASRAEGMDTIVVEDDGPGVPAEVRDRIFEPLVSTKPKGTGLGLAICRQICEQHGGTIELLASQGPGAAFQVRLPG